MTAQSATTAQGEKKSSREFLVEIIIATTKLNSLNTCLNQQVLHRICMKILLLSPWAEYSSVKNEQQF